MENINVQAVDVKELASRELQKTIPKMSRSLLGPNCPSRTRKEKSHEE